jgi:hypothetical protein
MESREEFNLNFVTKKIRQIDVFSLNIVYGVVPLRREDTCVPADVDARGPMQTSLKQVIYPRTWNCAPSGLLHGNSLPSITSFSPFPLFRVLRTHERGKAL